MLLDVQLGNDWSRRGSALTIQKHLFPMDLAIMTIITIIMLWWVHRLLK